jgi:hypothetical protein
MVRRTRSPPDAAVSGGSGRSSSFSGGTCASPPLGAAASLAGRLLLDSVEVPAGGVAGESPAPAGPAGAAVLKPVAVTPGDLSAGAAPPAGWTSPPAGPAAPLGVPGEVPLPPAVAVAEAGVAVASGFAGPLAVWVL